MRCRRCRKDKPYIFEEFRPRHRTCRRCSNKMAKKWRQSARGRVAIRRLRHANHTRTKESVYKRKDAPCHDCGKRYPRWVMEFDHRYGKVFKISNIAARSVFEVVKEADKCDVVCANCHKERTHRRRIAKAGGR